MRKQLLHFQNKAEKDFNANKSPKTLLYFGLALIVFFASTLFAVFTLPFRVLAKSIFKKEPGANIQDLNSKNFDKVVNSEELVLIDFWAEWCGPCFMMNPVIDEFAKESKSILIAKVNADSNREIIDKFKIRGLPQFVLLKQGKEIKRHAGPLTLPELREFCSKMDKTLA